MGTKEKEENEIHSLACLALPCAPTPFAFHTDPHRAEQSRGRTAERLTDPPSHHDSFFFFFFFWFDKKHEEHSNHTTKRLHEPSGVLLNTQQQHWQWHCWHWQNDSF